MSLGVAVKRNSINEPEKYLILLKVMALALLPEESILTEILNIQKDALIFGGLFDEFFLYFEKYWISQRGLKTFCVFDQLIRTNNAEESYHRDLHIHTQHKRPTIWRLIGIL